MFLPVVLWVLCLISCAKNDTTMFKYGKAVPLENGNITFSVYEDTDYYIEHSLPVLPEGSIVGFKEMEALILDKTGVQKIEPGAFQNLPNLTWLQIEECDLRRIEANIFNSLKVVYLLVGQCNVSFIAPDAFDGMTHLKSIVLDHNNLAALNPSWFANTPSLVDISMDFNSLEKIPANFMKNSVDRSLRQLDFYGNKIKEIDDDAFKGITSIKGLSLAQNNLTTLNGNFLRNVKMNILALNGNQIRCLPEKEWEKIFVANHTNVSHNPWDPECLERLRKWTDGHGIGVGLY